MCTAHVRLIVMHVCTAGARNAGRLPSPALRSACDGMPRDHSGVRCGWGFVAVRPGDDGWGTPDVSRMTRGSRRSGWEGSAQPPARTLDHEITLGRAIAPRSPERLACQ